MRTTSNGEIVSASEKVGMMYDEGEVWITSDRKDSLALISYQEFIQMANEIIRQKEDADAREN